MFRIDLKYEKTLIQNDSHIEIEMNLRNLLRKNRLTGMGSNTKDFKKQHVSNKYLAQAQSRPIWTFNRLYL